MKNKININDLEWQESSHEDFSSFRKSLGNNAGGKMLGTSLFKLAPGKKAFPFHCHHANEEAIFILEGSGTLRYGNEKIAITRNDYIALPCGREHAHQVINTSDAELIYLCISTMITPDVTEYPDSDKIGVSTGTAPGGIKTENTFNGYYRKKSDVDYFDGEK